MKMQILSMKCTGLSGEDENPNAYQKPFSTRFVRNSVTNRFVSGKTCQLSVNLMFELSMACHRSEHLS